jgi:hypothetical protein
MHNLTHFPPELTKPHLASELRRTAQRPAPAVPARCGRLAEPRAKETPGSTDKEEEEEEEEALRQGRSQTGQSPRLPRRYQRSFRQPRPEVVHQRIHSCLLNRLFPARDKEIR